MERDVFIDGRISVQPLPLSTGRRTKIKYRGLLAQSGAEKVYMHSGYSDNWYNTRDFEMYPVTTGVWETDFNVEGSDRLNFCFVDNAGNWDNNSGMNWQLEIVH